jgi:hypothetical protein
MKIAKVDLAPGAMEIRAVIMDRTSRGLKTSDFDIVRETKYKSATVSEYRRKLCRAGLIKRGPFVMVRGKKEKTWVENDTIGNSSVPILSKDKLKILTSKDTAKIVGALRIYIDSLISILKE